MQVQFWSKYMVLRGLWHFVVAGFVFFHKHDYSFLD